MNPVPRTEDGGALEHYALKTLRSPIPARVANPNSPQNPTYASGNR